MTKVGKLYEEEKNGYDDVKAAEAVHLMTAIRQLVYKKQTYPCNTENYMKIRPVIYLNIFY